MCLGGFFFHHQKSGHAVPCCCCCGAKRPWDGMKQRGGGGFMRLAGWLPLSVGVGKDSTGRRQDKTGQDNGYERIFLVTPTAIGRGRQDDAWTATTNRGRGAVVERETLATRADGFATDKPRPFGSMNLWSDCVRQPLAARCIQHCHCPSTKKKQAGRKIATSHRVGNHRLLFIAHFTQHCT